MIPPGGRKVVYLLGAGASFNALPVVGEMPEAFHRQPIWLRNALGGSLYTNILRRYTTELELLAGHAANHGSIDTYARALMLLGEGDKLASLKLHLSMFFLLEQAVERRSLHEPVTGGAPGKRDRIDVRYMPWLALLLNDQGTLSPRVTVITWNYDLQLEHAIAMYRGYTSLTDVHDPTDFWVYPAPERWDAKAATNPSVVHLNGIAGQAIFGSGARGLYRDLTKGDAKAYIEQLFELYQEHDQREQGMLRAMNRTFQFAWEKESIAQLGRSYATEAMKAAEVLIVIGYSFPAFNRAVDHELIKAFLPDHQMKARKRIHIQNPHMSADTFRHLFSLEPDKPRVTTDSETGQFYIPPELFK